MTSFTHTEYSTQHAGVARVENAVAALKGATARQDGARGAASLVLAAMVSALLVVANQMIDTWSDGHLLAAWMVLWLVAFSALALLATPARRAGVVLRDIARDWAESRRLATEDRRTWEVAMQDPRVMSELQHALGIATVRDIRPYY